MAEFVQKLKQASALTTAIIRMLFENPAALINNAQEKFRQKNYIPTSLNVPIPGLKASNATHLLEQGQLTLALQSIDAMGRIQRFFFRAQRRKIVGELELLNLPVRKTGNSAPGALMRFQGKGTVRSLYFVNNSLPYTQSGYTLRSHSLLKALQSNGNTAIAATRLGYPLVIGAWPRETRDIIDEIEYVRCIPWLYPANGIKRNEATVKMIVEEAVKQNVQILHTTTDFKNGLAISAAARQLGLPWVYEVRGQLESTWLSKFEADEQERLKKSEFYNRTSRKELEVMQAADAVLVLSNVSKQEIISRGVEPEKIFVIPNAINPNEDSKQFDKRELQESLGLSVSTGDVLFGTVSSLVDYEGLDTAVLALHHLPERYKLLIVGEGKARPSLESLVREQGLGTRVIFAGRQPSTRVWKWYGSLDIFIVPRRDTQVCRIVTPIKTLLAQAMEIPVVCSDLPALREVAPGARFVEPDDSFALAKGILSARDNWDGISKGKESVETRTWESNARIIECSYRYALRRTSLR